MPKKTLIVSRPGKIVSVDRPGSVAVVSVEGKPWKFSFTHYYSGWPKRAPKAGEEVKVRFSPDGGDLLSVRRVEVESA